MINSVTLLIRNVQQEIKILTHFNTNTGIRAAFRHITACPTQQAAVDGQAAEKAKMHGAFAQNGAVSSPPAVQGIPDPSHKGFKK